MADVAEYILQTLVENAVSIAGQILSNPKYLAEIVSALAFDQLVKQGSKYVINSLICRGLTEDEIGEIGSQTAAEEAAASESAGEAVASAGEAFAEAGTLAEATLAADELVGALGILSGVLGALLGVLSFFGLTSKEYREQKEKYDKQWKLLNTKMPELLTIKGTLDHSIQGDTLSLNWPALQNPPSNLNYTVTVNITSPVGDHIPPITSTVTSAEKSITSEHILLASSINIQVTASVKVKDHVFKSKMPLSTTITHQATLPSPKSVTIQHNVSDYSLIGIINGISSESQAVNTELIGVDFSDNTKVLATTKKDQASESVNVTFSNASYATFVGKGFEIQAQSLTTGLQSSKFTVSDLIKRLSPPSAIQYSLPAFGDSDPHINIKWALPSLTSDVHGFFMQIVTSSNNLKVIVNKFMPKTDGNLPTKGTFTLAEFKQNIGDEIQDSYIVRLYSTSNSTSFVNSDYVTCDKAFSVAASPSAVSASFTDTLRIIWTPVTTTSKYAVEMLERENQVPIFCHIVNIQKRTKGSYSLSSDDISKLTPGKQFTVRVFSVSDSESVLSSLEATSFPKAILYMDTVKNISITYDVEKDSIKVTFDCVKQANGYTLAVLQYRDNTSPVATIITKFTIPAEEAEKQIHYSLPLSEFRKNLAVSDNENCGFEIRALGSDSDIPSPYFRSDKRWRIIEQPKDTQYTYDANVDELTIACSPVPEFMSYRMMVRNEASGETLAKLTSSAPPKATWSGSDLRQIKGNQFACIAQTVGTEDKFSSKLTESLTKLTRLDSLSIPAVNYTSDVSSMKLCYPLVQNSQSYYFRLDLYYEASVKNIHTFDNVRPALSDSEVAVTFDLSKVLISPDASLVVTSHAKGGGEYINSNASQFSSGAIQSLPQPKYQEMTYNCRTQTLLIEWSEIVSSSFYSIDCINSQSRESVFSKSGIKATSFQIPASEFISHGKFTLLVCVTAHSGDGTKPYLPSTSKNEEASTDNLIESMSIRRINVSNSVVEWKVSSQWESKAKDIQLLVVTLNSISGEKQEIETTGEKQSIIISGLTSESSYKVSLLSGLSSNPTVIGIPLEKSIPGKVDVMCKCSCIITCLITIDAVLSEFNSFSSRHGAGVTTSGEIPLTVTAIGQNNAVAYTSLPVLTGCMFQLKVIRSGILVSIHNHSKGYLGMAVQHCVFGPSLYLGSEVILPKTNGTTEFYCLFLPLYVKFEAIKLFMKNSVTVCIKLHFTSDRLSK